MFYVFIFFIKMRIGTQVQCPTNSTIVSHTLCLKKVPILKLSVTLSDLNLFSKFLHCWQAYKICYKTHTTLPISP